MSKTSRKSKRKKTSGSKPRPRAAQDRAVYIGLIMIGLFVVLLAVPLTQSEYVMHVGLFYLLIMAIMVNFFTYRAYAGSKLARWQASLARLPLRWVGYGGKGGKPIETAHGRPEVRNMLIVSMIVSAIIIAALAVVVFGLLRG